MHRTLNVVDLSSREDPYCGTGPRDYVAGGGGGGGSGGIQAHAFFPCPMLPTKKQIISAFYSTCQEIINTVLLLFLSKVSPGVTTSGKCAVLSASGTTDILLVWKTS